MPELAQPARGPFTRYANILKLSLGFAALALLFVQVDLSALARLFASARVDMLLLSLFLFALLIFFSLLRLHLLIGDAVGSLWETTRMTMVGYFFNNFLPGGYGGDGYKVVALRARSASWGSSLALISVDRFSGVAVAMLAGVVYLLLYGFPTGIILSPDLANRIEVNPVWIFLGGAAAAILSLFAFVKLRDTHLYRRAINGLLAAKNAVTTLKPGTYFLVLVLSILAFASRVARFYTYAACFDVYPNPADIVFVLFIMHLAMVLPVTMGGLGVQEGAITAAMVAIGVDFDVAVAVSILNRATLWLAAIVGGLLFATRKAPAPQGVGAN